jgi:hypothetical protein
MTTISFNEIPQAIMELDRKIDILLSERITEPEVDRLMPVPGFQDYIEKKTGKRPARQTVYDLAFKRLVPFEKHGKYLYFRKSSIDAWLANGRQMK